MVKISSKLEGFDFSGGQKPPLGGLTIIKQKLKLWESALFSGYYIWIKCHQNQRYMNFPWVGGRSPLLGELHVTCDAHFRTRMSYSSQKPCVKIWFGFVEPFKSYHLNFPGDSNPLLGRLHVICDTHFRP